MEKHKKYDNYYGELKEYNEELSFDDYYDDELKKLVKNITKAGVKEILFDCNDRFADTMFIKTDESTDYKELMKILMQLRPHEFSEESKNHFRIWFD
jgi:biopolymer transport protein ExbD